jgi:hypothetical protein
MYSRRPYDPNSGAVGEGFETMNDYALAGLDAIAHFDKVVIAKSE